MRRQDKSPLNVNQARKAQNGLVMKSGEHAIVFKCQGV